MIISPNALFDLRRCESRGLDIFFLLLVVITAYLIYWFTIENRSLKEHFAAKWGKEKGSLLFFIFNKSWGVFLFGPLCTIAAHLLFPGYGLADFGFSLPAAGEAGRAAILWSISLVPFLAGLTWLGGRKTARSGGNFGRYPEIGMSLWGAGTFAIHSGFWILYLVAYELLFRGILLFPLAAAVGPWPAIGINMALYSAVHIPKGAGEAVGALFLGLLLCIITLQTGSIIVAVLAHIALAVTNGLSAFHYREDMRFGRSK